MDLVPYGDDDMWLVEAVETDPTMMKELGGPMPKEEVPRIHARRLGAIARGAWYYKVVDDEGATAGAIGIWRTTWQRTEISESGWTILPAFQGRGVATEALRLLLGRARDDGRWGPIHAFPAVTNAPSNALCRKLGFRLVEGCDVDYAGRNLHCNHWVLDA